MRKIVLNIKLNMTGWILSWNSGEGDENTRVERGRGVGQGGEERGKGGNK